MEAQESSVIQKWVTVESGNRRAQKQEFGRTRETSIDQVGIGTDGKLYARFTDSSGEIYQQLFCEEVTGSQAFRFLEDYKKSYPDVKIAMTRRSLDMIKEQE